GVAPEVAKRFTVYTLTFAGFDGEPPVQPPYLDAFAKSIEDLIAAEKLDKPILVGHSLGGHLAVRVAEEIPSRIGAVMVVDMLPLFPPPQAAETPQTRETQAAGFRNAILAATPAQFGTAARAYMTGLVTDPKNADFLTQRSLRSDRATYAGAAYELSLADLRPNLSKIALPLEVLAPADPETVTPQILQFYTAAFAGTPNLDVEAVAPSKHFIMYDQPAKFQTLLDAFLAKNGG
ncbi:MAG TPA: alpha/beta hydrolase, partial [Candidatus Baltobacteraceae bacterium]|nr:alpha/beta hydrolase [Candidatus Baltobacteraceae bacterium]